MPPPEDRFPNEGIPKCTRPKMDTLRSNTHWKPHLMLIPFLARLFSTLDRSQVKDMERGLLIIRMIEFLCMQQLTEVKERVRWRQNRSLFQWPCGSGYRQCLLCNITFVAGGIGNDGRVHRRIEIEKSIAFLSIAAGSGLVHCFSINHQVRVWSKVHHVSLTLHCLYTRQHFGCGGKRISSQSYEGQIFPSRTLCTTPNSAESAA